MEVYSLPFWDDKSTYCVQTNNPSEEAYSKILGRTYLESCGPTSAANIILCLDNKLIIDVVSKIMQSNYEIPLDETIMDFFSNRVNYSTFKKVRDFVTFKHFLFNEIAQYYPVMFRAMFDLESDFAWGLTVEKVKKFLQNQHGVIVCLKKPGHFVAIVKISYNPLEPDKSIITYRDPWPGNYWHQQDNV